MEDRSEIGKKGRDIFFARYPTPEALAERMRDVRRRQALYSHVGKVVVEALEAKEIAVQEATPMK